MTGASIGAGAIVIAGVHVGAWSMIAAGAVVTRSVEPFSLVVGVPARPRGWVCRCGVPAAERGVCLAGREGCGPPPRA